MWPRYLVIHEQIVTQCLAPVLRMRADIFSPPTIIDSQSSSWWGPVNYNRLTSSTTYNGSFDLFLLYYLKGILITCSEYSFMNASS